MFRHSRLKLARIVSLLGSVAVAAQQRPQELPADLVREVIHNELNEPQGTQLKWRYVSEKEADGKQETREVIETGRGVLDRLIAIGGKPLGGFQRQQEMDRLLQIWHSPVQQAKLEQSRRKGVEQCDAFLKMIPDAFVFEYTGEHAGQNLWKLTFQPKPGYTPPSWQGKILHQMSGEMWVDADQKRLASVSGQLLNEVKFAGGLLGHLEKGGRFRVARAEISRGQWKTVEMLVDMNGKALLFKAISVQQKERHRDFERVPEDLSIADAAALLMKQSLMAAKNSVHSR